MQKIKVGGPQIKKLAYRIFASNRHSVKSNSKNYLSSATFWSEAPLWPYGTPILLVFLKVGSFNCGVCCLWRVCIFSSKNARLLNFKDGSDCTSLMSLVALFNILINIDVFGLITSILGKGNHWEKLTKASSTKLLSFKNLKRKHNDWPNQQSDPCWAPYWTPCWDPSSTTEQNLPNLGGLYGFCQKSQQDHLVFWSGCYCGQHVGLLHISPSEKLVYVWNPLMVSLKAYQFTKFSIPITNFV